MARWPGYSSKAYRQSAWPTSPIILNDVGAWQGNCLLYKVCACLTLFPSSCERSHVPSRWLGPTIFKSYDQVDTFSLASGKTDDLCWFSTVAQTRNTSLVQCVSSAYSVTFPPEHHWPLYFLLAQPSESSSSLETRHGFSPGVRVTPLDVDKLPAKKWRRYMK